MKFFLSVLLVLTIYTVRSQIKLPDTCNFYRTLFTRDSVFVYWDGRIPETKGSKFSGIPLIPYYHKDSIWNLFGLTLHDAVELFQEEMIPFLKTRKFPWGRVY